MVGNGVVVDPRVLTEEIDGLRRRGVDLSGLRISANAHLIMPYHLLLDQAGEAKLGKREIGTTKRGIGPAYADKAARLGIRLQDVLDEKILKQKITAAMEPKRQTLREFAKDPRLDLHHDDRGLPGLRAPARALHRRHASDRLEGTRRGPPRGVRGRPGHAARHRPRHVSVRHLLEPGRGAACVGAGVGPKSIDEVWGITKAYCTRVGAGPFPTELHDEMGDRIREAGGEFGTTTGRPRRCGWLDLVALRYAVRVNGLTGLVLTKLDVLTGIDLLPVAVRYSGPEGATFDEFPYHQSVLHRARGDLLELPGWHEDITGVREIGDLPGQRPGLHRLHRGGPRNPRADDRRRPRPRGNDLDRRFGAAPLGGCRLKEGHVRRQRRQISGSDRSVT